MKRPLRIAVLASPLVLAFACAHEGRRDGGYDERRAAAAAPQPGDWVVGRLVAVTSHTITIADPDGDRHTLWLDRQTTVTVDGRDADLYDLRPGQDVRAALDEGANGEPVAVSIATAGGGARWRGDAYRNGRRERR